MAGAALGAAAAFFAGAAFGAAAAFLATAGFFAATAFLAAGFLAAATFFTATFLAGAAFLAAAGFFAATDFFAGAAFFAAFFAGAALFAAFFARAMVADGSAHAPRGCVERGTICAVCSRRNLLAVLSLTCALTNTRAAMADGPVTVSAVGDVALAWRVDLAIRQHQYDPFREVRAALSGADLAIANVECVMTEAPESAQPERAGQPLIRAHPSSARVLANAGIDVASVANNHAFDFGARGALDTHRALREAGVIPLGGGRAEDAREPLIREVRGLRVGALAFAQQVNHSPGRGARVAWLDARSVDEVRALKARVDVVLVSVHWGHEFVETPTPGQVAMAHRLVDAGADAIIGHHPHVLQSVERYNDRPIIYSLGNFVFGHQPTPRDLSAILELSLQRGARPIVRAALRPVLLEGRLGTPTPVTGRRAAPIIARIRASSRRFRTALIERDGVIELDFSTATATTTTTGSTRAAP